MFKFELWTAGSRVILRLFTICSWAAVVGFKSLIWERHPLGPSFFTMDTLIVQIFWILLVAIQGLYICFSVRTMEQLLCVSPLFDAHFAFHNLLHILFVTLVGQSEFRLAEVTLVLDFFNLIVFYGGHYSNLELAHWIKGLAKRPVESSIPLRLDHAGFVAGPLSWVVVAIYWNGAMMIPQRESLVAGVLGNISVWSMLAVGLFYGIAYKDFTITMLLSVLYAAVGLGQYRLMDGSNGLEHSMQFIPLVVQCSFAFVITALLFVFTLALLLAKWRDGKTKSNSGQRLQQQENPSTEEPVVGVEVMVAELKEG